MLRIQKRSPPAPARTGKAAPTPKKNVPHKALMRAPTTIRTSGTTGTPNFSAGRVAPLKMTSCMKSPLHQQTDEVRDASEGDHPDDRSRKRLGHRLFLDHDSEGGHAQCNRRNHRADAKKPAIQRVGHRRGLR